MSNFSTFGIELFRLGALPPAASPSPKLCNSTKEVGWGECGIEPDRLIEVGDGVVEVVLETVSGAAAQVGACKSGSDPNRFSDVGDGALEVAFFGMCEAPAEASEPLREGYLTSKSEVVW